MDIWLLLVVALAPGLFWLWYFYHRDRYEPEPLPLIARMFFLGMAAALLAYAVETLTGVFIAGMLFTAVAVPVIEESLKFLMVLVFVYRNREFDEPLDGIIYATATALGFATLENLVYLLQQPGLSSLVVTGLVRAVLSVPGHALFGVFWGYALGIAKFRPAGNRSTVILAGLLLGIAVHGVFNFLLGQSYTGLVILILIVLPVVWWAAEGKIRALLLPG